jgi:uncharacterized HAD superfamily protein
MRIGIDLDDVILDRSDNIINDSKKEFRKLRKWAGPAQHYGKHQLICVTARGLQYMQGAIDILTKNRIIFDEYHFLGGRHKQVVPCDYLIDNSLTVKENWLGADKSEESFIQFWTEETGQGIKRLSEAIEIIGFKNV